ncbi:MAG: hypothetical protein KGL39_17710 [Patescibacteria group bacterium]|nr:hypothetical protein [Patescibacteria group bacterium]
MKRILPLSLVALAFALTGCNHPVGVAAMMREAEPLVRARCTNDVIGFTRIIAVHVDCPQSAPHTWRADATVEHFNAAGGIERTNLPYRFAIYYDSDGPQRLLLSLDETEIAKREARALEPLYEKAKAALARSARQ